MALLFNLASLAHKTNISVTISILPRLASTSKTNL
jgi:hypothetical protein